MRRTSRLQAAASFALACLAGLVLSLAAPAARAEGFDCPRAGIVSGDLRADALRKRLAKAQPAYVLAIGSSSTEGVGASGKSATYPARLEADLRHAWPGASITVENAGIGGEKADATLQRLEDRLAAARYDMVIWQVGTNDALGKADPVAFQDMVRRGIALARDARVEIVLMNQQYFPGIKDIATYERFVAALADVARDAGVPVLDRYSLMKGWRDESPARLLAALSGDRFHMGDEGYACLAQLVAGDIAGAVGPAQALPVAGVALPPRN
ncbi:MAG: SGNH/GDSL hydrolase family protein [Alsobacter sp.]